MDDNESWEWQEGDDYMQKESNLEISQYMWDGMTQNNDLSHMFEETTPIKACGDFPYHFDYNENAEKATDECNEFSSHGERRRMLQFENKVMDPPYSSKDMSSLFLKSKERIDCVENALPEVSEWRTMFQDDMFASRFDGMDCYESWLSDCLKDYHASSELNPSMTSGGQIGITEACNIETGLGVDVVEQQPVLISGSSIFKGRKSHMRTPKKPASCVAYPFAFIKPCGSPGDVTLKDINDRIQTQPSRLKHRKDDPSASYPTSSLSGKPIVGRTKIRTEGGKGSVTVMRTIG
ncbi:hypothetical protein Nepgr_004332 [Nepenthes gracilis]|uniref:Protein XRI1 n=1 Tax=Nepenthes gracilis TaxID=150966 RepID=A0AAD3S186_NEPGR|nr:hypothetical protein Nepgr_004332 [Nepenthes gracilis]